MSTTGWINRIGDWNPQFLRECRGHLRPRSVIAAVGSSLVLQVLIFLPLLRPTATMTAADHWLVVCQLLTWTIPYFLFVVGGYYLVNDLAQEEKRGTLNFIRLSPRPASGILLGKLLGVPILPYLIVLSLVPLHLWSMVQGGLPVIFFFSYYALLAATAFLCFSLALLMGVTSQLRPQQTPVAIAFAGLGLFLFAPGFMVWNISTSWRRIGNISELFANDPMFSSVSWVYTSLTTDIIWAHGFTLINLAILARLVWSMLERLFHQPRTTLLSKRLSYLLTAYLNIVLWGFFQNENATNWTTADAFAVLYMMNFGLIMLLMLALTPHRQQLFDWLNYPRTSMAARLWADKSPAVTAVGVNILLVSLLLVPTSVLAAQGVLPLAYLLLMPLSVALSWLIYATVTQLIFTTRVRTPALWAMGTIMMLILVPLIVLVLLQTGDPPVPMWMALRTLLGYPFYEYPQSGYLSAVAAGVGLQALILLGLLVMLQRRLSKLRRSVQMEGAS